MKKFKYFLSAFLLTIAGVGAAATFNLFQPAAGILKGNPSTYVTTAAASSDVISLWSGTCDAASFLRGDGSCQPALSGTVPVGNGGTGTTTLAGVLKGNGTSAVTSAASTDVISLWSGTCNGTSFLRGDGSCQTVGGGTGANPTATIGLTATNGVATTFMRSDAAPALSQSISPTWTGSHVFQGLTFELENVLPRVRLDESDAAADNRVWGTSANNEAFTLSALNDALTVNTAFMTVNRTGTTVDSIALSATAVTVNGQSVCRADGTGCPSSGGDATLAGNNTWTGDNIWEGLTTIADSDGGSILHLEGSVQRSIFFESDPSTVVASIDSTPDAPYIGFHVDAKTNPLWLWAGGAERLKIDSDGSWDLGASSPGTAGQVLTSNGSNAAPTWQAAATETSGTFTATLADGCTTTPTVTAKYSKIGSVVSLMIPAVNCTTDGGPIQFSGIPALINPFDNAPGGGESYIICDGTTYTDASRAMLASTSVNVITPRTACVTGTLTVPRWAITYSTNW